MLEEKTGWLSCGRLDRESKEEYILVITAREGHKSVEIPIIETYKNLQDTCTVRIGVADENDNPPKWKEAFRDGEEMTLRVDDETKLLQQILTLSAEDPDAGENGALEYSIVDDPTQLLDIEPNTGRIFFARFLVS